MHGDTHRSSAHLDSDDLVLLMGGPGSGKGTTGLMLAERLGAEIRSTGQLLRVEHDPALMAIMESGDLVPEQELERVLASAIQSLRGQALILDSTKKPREAEWLLGKLQDFGRRLVVVIYLEIDDQVARQRILIGNRGRQDDTPEFQDHRWHEFYTETIHAIDVYRRAGLLETIQGDQPLDELVSQMLAVISRRRAALPAS